MPEEKKGLAFPEIPAELKLEDWLPQEPTLGPPFPKWLGIFWPWYKPPVPPPVYTCPYCGAEFTTQEELNQHIASAHPEQPPVYTCPYCGATFSSQAELDAHIQAQHPSVPNIILQNLIISPTSVEVGQKVSITATATNIGNATGSKIITCQVDSSATQQSIYLEPSASQVVSFEATPMIAKTYAVSIDGLTGSFVATAPPVISAEITDAYVFDKYAETNPLWNGYAHISLPQPEDDEGNVIAVDWTVIASTDTIIGFVLQNKSNIPVAFNFRLWQHQWTMVDSKQKYITIDLNPTDVAPVPMENGVYQADKNLLPGEVLLPNQRGFMAAPAIIGRRWCTFYCDVTKNGQGIVSASVKGWGGY